MGASGITGAPSVFHRKTTEAPSALNRTGVRGKAVGQAASLKAEIARILRQRDPIEACPPGFRKAAVLLPLYKNENGLHVVLTKRTESVPTHKGQISFPGGGFSEADGDLRATALREAQEEIGLQPVDVEIAGALDDTVTATSRYSVRPFVGFVPNPYAYRLDPFEIERLIHLPVHGLLSGTPFREETWQRDGLPITVFFYEYGGDTIWGLTARILKQFIEVVGTPIRESGLLSQGFFDSEGA
jgi:8-oxo-dGTP pyrophosphatase MutT (NUDIX family)